MSSEYTTWGDVIKAVTPLVSQKELEAIIEIFGAWSEVTSTCSQIVPTNMLGGYLYIINKDKLSRQDEDILNNNWRQGYEPTLVLLAVQVRIITKSLYTLRNKVCILINLIDQLNKEDKNGNIPHSKTEEVLKEATQGKLLSKHLLKAIDIPNYKSRRHDAEHNIDKDFQQQMKTILSSRDLISKSNELKTTLIKDYKDVIRTRENLNPVIDTVLFDYLLTTRT